MEILGGLAGLLLLVVLSAWDGPWLWVCYAAAVLPLTWVLIPTRALRLAAMGVAILALPSAVELFRWQPLAFYRGLHHLPVRYIVHTSDSLYQKIELVEDAAGQLHGFRNGMQFFNPGHLEEFNAFLSGLPVLLARPRRVLIAGSGSMSSVAKVAPVAESVTTVELDRRVAEVGRRYLAAWNRLGEIPRHRLIIDDAAHFFWRSQDRFDLIILDLPPPITIQLGFLYTEDFYRLVRARLAPGGVVSLYAGGVLVPENRLARQIVAGVLRVFPECIVIDERTLGQVFVLAGDGMPISADQVAEAIRAAAPAHTVRVYARGRGLEQLIGGAAPMSVRRPGALWWINAQLLDSYWRPPADRGAPL